MIIFEINFYTLYKAYIGMLKLIFPATLSVIIAPCQTAVTAGTTAESVKQS
jgi:hypothetical protein